MEVRRISIFKICCVNLRFTIIDNLVIIIREISQFDFNLLLLFLGSFQDLYLLSLNV